MESHDYDNRSAVEDWEDYFTKWQHTRESIRSRTDAFLDISFGAHPRERIDWFPANTPTCTVIFIHGGYWQWNHKDEFTFLAEPWLNAGADVAMLGYPLAPEATVPQIIESVKRGVAFIKGESKFEIILMGWSAGAQLAAKAGSKADKIICLSGIYDMRPLLDTPINDGLRLVPEIAATCSPFLNPPQVNCLVGVGADERLALRRQAEAYSAALQAREVPVLFREWTGLHHYSILDECASENSEVFKDMKKFVFS